MWMRLSHRLLQAALASHERTDSASELAQLPAQPPLSPVLTHRPGSSAVPSNPFQVLLLAVCAELWERCPAGIVLWHNNGAGTAGSQLHSRILQHELRQHHLVCRCPKGPGPTPLGPQEQGPAAVRALCRWCAHSHAHLHMRRLHHGWSCQPPVQPCATCCRA